MNSKKQRLQVCTLHFALCARLMVGLGSPSPRYSLKTPYPAKRKIVALFVREGNLPVLVSSNTLEITVLV